MGRKDNKKKLAKMARAVEDSFSAERSSKGPQVAGSSLPAKWLWGALALLLPLTLWSYWPTLIWMEDQWRREADYSHGYLVLPLAIALLMYRKQSFPGFAHRIHWAGVSLLVLAFAIRIVGRFAYMDFLDGWSLVPWIGGIVWMLCGLRAFKWAFPAILFLIFLVPMPYRAESLLSWRLQSISTGLSVGLLRVLGFPAVPEGNTIWLEDHQMMVEEACSGLRIFVGMMALAFWFAVLSTRHWLDRLFIVVAALPIAVVVNVLRVSATVLAYHWLSGAAAHVAHDLFGHAMIVAGFLLMSLAKSFWERLYRNTDRIIPVNLRPMVDQTS